MIIAILIRLKVLRYAFNKKGESLCEIANYASWKYILRLGDIGSPQEALHNPGTTVARFGYQSDNLSIDPLWLYLDSKKQYPKV